MPKTIIITEQQLYKVKSLISESATDRFIDKLILNKLPEQLKHYYNTPVNTLVREHPDLVSPQSLGVTQDELNQLGNLPLKDFIRLSISRMFDIGHGKGPRKYLKGIFRIVLDELNYLQHPDQNSIQNLKNDVMYIMQAAQNGTDPDAASLDSNLNGLSAGQLHSMFKEKRKAFAKAIRDKVSSAFGRGKANTDYKVVPILKHEDAVRYAPYTDWCITFSSPANYNQYVQGGRRFYIFLRNGYKGVERKAGENCPMDEYGLSMISVLVDMEGNIDYITTRWNHTHDGEYHNPDAETVEMFQKAIGVNLYAVCKPYTREELKAMGITPFDEVQDLLDSGVEPVDIFSHITNAGEGFARVQLNGKYNYLTKELKVLSEQWVDWCKPFRKGFAVVGLNGKENYLTPEGKVLSEQWFNYCGPFCEGFGRVELNEKYNYLTTEGKILSEQWFDECYSFDKGFGIVELNEKYNYLTPEGKVLSEQWLDGCCSFDEGFGLVKLNGKYNYLTTEGKYLSEQWFDYCDSFREGFAIVRLNGKENYLTPEGKLLSEQWFDDCGPFREGSGAVRLNGNGLWIDKEGKLYKEKPKINENKLKKNIIITEEMGKEILKDLDMSEHRFMSNVKFFLAQLLEDPVNSKPSEILLQHGFTRVRLLKELADLGILERSERLSDKDKDGKWKTATMLVKYKVRKKGLNTAILKVYSKYFDKDGDRQKMNEEGGTGSGGATSCDSSGAFMVPLFPMVRRNIFYSMKKNKKKKRRKK